MVPAILRSVEEADEYGQTERMLTGWMKRNRIESETTLIADLVRTNLKSGKPDRGAIALLIRNEPQTALAVLREARAAPDGASAVRRCLTAQGIAELTLAERTSFFDSVLDQMELSDSGRSMVYMQLGRVALAARRFLDGREAVESSPSVRRMIGHPRKQLEAELRKSE